MTSFKDLKYKDFYVGMPVYDSIDEGIIIGITKYNINIKWNDCVPICGYSPEDERIFVRLLLFPMKSYLK